MARIKGKWVGQVVVEYYDLEPGTNQEDKKYFGECVTEGIRDSLYDDESNRMAYRWTPYNVTVTQLHADLYRDEPSEWTKEEATL